MPRFSSARANVEMNANEGQRGYHFERCANSSTAILMSFQTKQKFALKLDFWDGLDTRLAPIDG